jgi:hypothetical protein
MIGLYLYASGAQRQAISILSTIGLCESYSNLITQKKTRHRKSVTRSQVEQPAPHRTGTLHQLSDSMRQKARELASTGLYGTVYDNINMNFKNAEQIIGRHGILFFSFSCLNFINLSPLQIPKRTVHVQQSSRFLMPNLKTSKPMNFERLSSNLDR